jgi:DNA transformation protein
MNATIGFLDEVIDLLGPFGTVSVRPMGTGHGLHVDGLLLGVVIERTFWLKTDAINRLEFEVAGACVLSHEACASARLSRLSTDVPGSFHSAPGTALHSAADMLPWARSAYAAALRSGYRLTARADH